MHLSLTNLLGLRGSEIPSIFNAGVRNFDDCKNYFSRLMKGVQTADVCISRFLRRIPYGQIHASYLLT